ncbi:hypothetical protein KI387_021430, partial [Taxus chinensis]
NIDSWDFFPAWCDLKIYALFRWGFEVHQQFWAFYRLPYFEQNSCRSPHLTFTPKFSNVCIKDGLGATNALGLSQLYNGHWLFFTSTTGSQYQNNVHR